jgi:hypothetical protein
MAFKAPQQTSGPLEHSGKGRSERRALTDKMMRPVLLHFAGLEPSALRGYTYERYETDYLDAKADLDIFDASGKLVFQGREFRSGVAGYWRPSSILTSSDSASNEQNWGRHPAGRVL